MGSVPREQLGIASGLLAITRSLGQTIGIAVLGAVWASSVLRFAGSAAGSPEEASSAAQAAGLQVTVLAAAGLVAVALVVALFAWRSERSAVAA